MEVMMKKYLAFLASIAFVMVSISAFAGGIKENTNQSAEFCKTLNRNASTDVDAAFFNPAGTAYTADGLYLYLSNQTIFQGVTIENGYALANKDKFEGDKGAPAFPNLYILWKKDNYAVSLGFAPIGGGGSATFDEGLPSFHKQLAGIAGNFYGAGVGTTLSMLRVLAGAPALPGATIAGLNGVYGTVTGYDMISKFSGSSAFYSGQIGFAYKVIEQLSIGAMYRFIYAKSSYKGLMQPELKGSVNTYIMSKEEVDAELTGMSHGAVISLSSQPVKDLTLGLRYEWYSIMPMETEAKKQSATANAMAPYLADGATSYETLPMMVAFGVAYKVVGLRIEADFNYYLNKLAKWGGDAEEDYDNGWEAGIGLDYTLPMFPMNIGLGYQYTLDGGNENTRTDLNEGLNSHAIGVGATYTPIDKLSMTLAYNFVYYVPRDVDAAANATTTYKKLSHSVAVGATMKAF